MSSAPDVPGADAVTAWFGRWPSFHDAEILALHLNRAGSSLLRIHAWNLESHIVDGKSSLRLTKHAVVTFRFTEISDLELADFSVQNVIYGLGLEEADGGFLVTLKPCYGLAGFIKAAKVRVELLPGQPEDE